MKCKNCNTEFEGNICPKCHTQIVKVKKKLYKKWWFWIIIALLAVMAIGAFSEEESGSAEVQSSDTKTNVIQSSTSVSKYKKVSIDTMLSDLDSNSMRATSDYKDKFVEFNAVISSIDSHGAYITVVGNTIKTRHITCYLEKEHLDFLMKKSEGDRVTIKGQITSVTDTFDYSMNVDYISDISN